MVTEIWCLKETYIAGQALGVPYEKCFSMEGGLQNICHLATDNALKAGFFYGFGWTLFMIGFIGILMILLKRALEKWLKRKTQIALQESMRSRPMTTLNEMKGAETFAGLAEVKAAIEDRGIYAREGILNQVKDDKEEKK
jgi:hypothetical protein